MQRERRNNKGEYNMKRALKVISICSLAVAVLFVAYSLASAQGITKNMVKKAESKADTVKADLLLRALNEELIEENAKLKKQCGNTGKNVEELDRQRKELEFTSRRALQKFNKAALKTAEDILSRLKQTEGIYDAYMARTSLKPTGGEMRVLYPINSDPQLRKAFETFVEVTIGIIGGEIILATCRHQERCPDNKECPWLELNIDNKGYFDIKPCML
jgi:hypothetical protein